MTEIKYEKRTIHSLLLSFILVLAAFGVSSVIAAEMVLDPSTGEMVEAPQYGGSITYGRPNHGEHTDAWFIGGWATHFVSEVTEKLVIGDWAIDRKINHLRTYDQPFSIMTGALAERWLTPDPTTIIVHVRKGVNWHDKAPMNGRELTASDVEFNFHRLYGLGSGFTEVSPVTGSKKEIIDSVTATDKWTVVFKLTRPDLFAGEKLLDAWESQIYPPEVIKQHGDITDWRNLVGTGPMELANYDEGRAMKWTRVDNYWGFDEKFPQNRLPYVDEINAVVMTEMATRLAALRSGKIDILGTAGDSQLRSIDQVKSLRETNPEIKMWTFDFRAGTGFVFNNINNSPFNDIRVRQAMQMALDLETINETFFSGMGDATPNGLMSNSKAGVGTPFEEWPEEIKPYYRYDPEGAKKLLAEAGYPDGFKTRLDYDVRADPSYAELITAYWRAIGVEVENYTADATQTTAYWRDNTAEGLIGAVTGITYSATQLENWTTGFTWNGAAGSDSKYDELWQRAHTATTMEEFNRWAKAANLRLSELQWIITGPVTPQFNVAQPWIKGYNGEVAISIQGHYSTVLTRVWVDQALKKEMGF